MPAGLLGIEELDRAEIASILARAKDFQPMQSQSLKKLDTLRGKMIVNLFYEASTRTRTSFDPQRLHQLRHSSPTRWALERDRRWPTTEQTIRQINARLLG